MNIRAVATGDSTKPISSLMTTEKVAWASANAPTRTKERVATASWKLLSTRCPSCLPMQLTPASPHNRMLPVRYQASASAERYQASGKKSPIY